MPTREEIRIRMLHELSARGLHPSDPSYAFALQAMEDMNQGVADLDDELADIAARLRWLARAPTWVNQRKPGEFEAFVAARFDECTATLVGIRSRWEQYLRGGDPAAPPATRAHEPPRP